MANGTMNPAGGTRQSLSPAQRAALFAQTTRKHWQMLPGINANPLGRHTFDLPKARLLSGIRLLVTANLKASHNTSTNYTPAAFAPFTLLRRVGVGINNGFNPFYITGRNLYFYNLLSVGADVIERQTSGRYRTVQGTTASSSGTDNAIRFMVDLPIALNERDPIGLILLQNQETTVTVSVDIGDESDLHDGSAGYSYELSNIVITPFVETFSIPGVQEAFPDLSVLKLVQDHTETVPGPGQFRVALPVGLTYRKLIVYIEDNSGGEADGDIPGDLELVFNQADTPVRINPHVLAGINQSWYGFPLPQGLFVFDWTYQGLPNYGGSRDYIDTERLTEFWFRFQAAGAGTVSIVAETLSRLRTN